MLGQSHLLEGALRTHAVRSYRSVSFVSVSMPHLLDESVHVASKPKRVYARLDFASGVRADCHSGSSIAYSLATRGRARGAVSRPTLYDGTALKATEAPVFSVERIFGTQ